MKLLELIEYPAQPDEFELLNLEAPIDQELLKTIIDERNLKLVYNGVLLDDHLDKLIGEFHKELAQYFEKETYDPIGIAAFYDYATMCIYAEEIYKVPDSNDGGSLTWKKRIVFERIGHTNRRKKNVIKFLTEAEYDKVVADNPDIIDLNYLLEFK